jgi:peptide/nickel transport system permease protein
VLSSLLRGLGKPTLYQLSYVRSRAKRSVRLRAFVPMLVYVLRRLAQGAAALVVVAFAIYGLERALRPENYPDQAYFPHLYHDVERALLHFDYGRACLWPGCPPIHVMWLRGYAGDLWLLAGGLAFGVLVGTRLGVWCARHPRSLRARVLEGSSMIVYCIPVWLFGFLLLFAFDPDIGRYPIPYFFDIRPHTYVSPLHNPWDWFRSYLVPWIVVGAPLAAAALRATAAVTIGELDADHVRTADAIGLRRAVVVRRYAAPVAYASITQLVWAYLPTFVTNVVFVEWVFNVPGFFGNLRRAIDRDPSFPGLDIPMLQAITLWAAILTIMLGILADLALARIDPRIRETL